MAEQVMEIFSILRYLFEGYCIQFFFGGFAKPKLHRLKNAQWAAGIAWIGIRFIGGALFSNIDSTGLTGKMLFSSIALFAFCVSWYKGNILLQIFLVIQFISLRELAFWTGYSFLYIGDRLIYRLIYEAGAGKIPIEDLPSIINAVSNFFVILVGVAQETLLFLSIRKIVVSCYDREKERMGKEVVFYLLPAVAGVLIDVLVTLLLIVVEDGKQILLYEKYPVLYLIIPMIAMVLLGAIVLSFQLYQNMAALQEERAEKIILENQLLQLQNSMVEVEHLYDGIRSVKHDMKNQMAVLQNLIRKRYPPDGDGEDEEVRHYFEDMYQSVEQLDSRVHTGNAISDAVVGSKFRYAEKQVQGIRLDASGFILPRAASIKTYDMGIILNNGLDNAIEACMKMREKQPDAEAYITIRSFMKRNMYFIEIENSFDGAVLLHRDSGLPASTKENKEVHGIGLKNIKKCAEKYGGDMHCIVKDNIFTLSVMVKG